MMSALAFLLTLSVIIMVHEWGHYITARKVGVKVERFSMGFGPRIWGIERNGTDYCICLLPLGGYVKMAGELPDTTGPVQPWEYRAKSVGQRMAIVFAGPAINYVLAVVLFTIVFCIGAPVATSSIGQVLEGYPAESAGLQVGDKVLSVNGEAVTLWEDMTKAIRAQKGDVALQIDREGQLLALTLAPKIEERTNIFGAKKSFAIIGVAPSGETVLQRYNPFQAVIKAVDRVYFLTDITIRSLWQMATGGMSFKQSVTGPVGIFYLTSDVAKQGFVALLQLMAALSTSIGFFNFLPIPVLDGGHLVFLLVEKIKGKAVSLEAQETFFKIGLGLLLFLLIAVTYNDIVRFDVFGKLLALVGLK